MDVIRFDHSRPWRWLRLQNCSSVAGGDFKFSARAGDQSGYVGWGWKRKDDAIVYRLDDDRAVVATTDFFMPVVDDPFDFGAIAAANALSDIYAVGGRPIFALAVVGMPTDKLPPEVIAQVLTGGAKMAERAGIIVGGGHSIDSPEPIYGLAVVGLVHPDQVKRNSTAQDGDVLILGKALGVGILSAAFKNGKIVEYRLRPIDRQHHQA